MSVLFPIFRYICMNKICLLLHEVGVIVCCYFKNIIHFSGPIIAGTYIKNQNEPRSSQCLHYWRGKVETYHRLDASKRDQS